MSKFTLGICTVPDGRKGPWEIQTFELTPKQASAANLSIMFSRSPELMVDPGTYKKLMHHDRGAIVMSNTPMEIRTNLEAYINATGRVLINGLGMGMLLEGILTKPEVQYVRVIEMCSDLIELVGPHFEHDPRVEIVHANAFEYQPPKDDPSFDYAWHDIWDNICPDNFDEMSKLTRKWRKPRTKKQGVWSRELIRSRERRYR